MFSVLFDIPFLFIFTICVFLQSIIFYNTSVSQPLRLVPRHLPLHRGGLGGANLQPSILHRGGWVSANLQLAGLTTPPTKLRFTTSPINMGGMGQCKLCSLYTGEVKCSFSTKLRLPNNGSLFHLLKYTLICYLSSRLVHIAMNYPKFASFHQSVNKFQGLGGGKRIGAGHINLI